MIELHLTRLDWIILVGYLVVIGIIGVAAGLRVRETEHYFLGNRGFGRWLMIGQSFGVGTHAEMPVSLAGAVYSVGFSGIWYQWKNLFATPFYWLIAPVFRRLRRTTIGEAVEDRYGAWMALLYTIFALAFFIINLASMLKGAAKVISQAGGTPEAADQIVYAMTAVFVAYSFVGGLLSAAWTDFFQGFLIIALSFMLIPLGWTVVGGFEGMRTTLDPHYLSIATPAGIGPWFIFLLTINGLIGIIAQPHQLAAVATGRDERACREGMFFGNYVKRFCTVGWALVGLLVAAMVMRPGSGLAPLRDPEDAFGFACRELLFPGALGLLIASVLAANMSTCSAIMVDSGALFTKNIYQRYMVRKAPDRHYLWAGRISGLVLAGFGMTYSLFFIDRVLNSFLLTETMATYMGISIFGGILWRRANRWGALASLAGSLIVNCWVLTAQGRRLDHWDPNVFGLSLLAGIAALVVVSWATPAEPASSLTPFFERLHEPVLGSAPSGTRLILVDAGALLCGQASWRHYREDWSGFVRGWALVIALVFATWFWLQW
jgi:Na+/proline symporter